MEKVKDRVLAAGLAAAKARGKQAVASKPASKMTGASVLLGILGLGAVAAMGPAPTPAAPEPELPLPGQLEFKVTTTYKVRPETDHVKVVWSHKTDPSVRGGMTISGYFKDGKLRIPAIYEGGSITEANTAMAGWIRKAVLGDGGDEKQVLQIAAAMVNAFIQAGD